MNDSFIFAEVASLINHTIKQTFKETQRVKLTCFDVSPNYIIFGASSGGVYVFSRKSSEFIKLIPSKDGAAIDVCISPNEKHVAVASAKGSVIVLQNCFQEGNLRYQVFLDHEGSLITAVKWNEDDIYVGDNLGKVSLISLTNLLRNAIFQTSSAVIMYLEAPVVQIDTYDKYILVSTKNKSYLCDTGQHRYRQLGKKARYGPFGACFYNKGYSPSENFDTSNDIRRVFQIMKESSQLEPDLPSKNINLYCARPGGRIWQADFDGTIILTQLYKNSALDAQVSRFLRVDFAQANARLDMRTTGFENLKIGFEKLLFFNGSLLVSFTSETIYVINPVSSSIIFCRNDLKPIYDVKIVENSLYVWHSAANFTIISAFTLENLVLKTLYKKQYLLCADLCDLFSSEILHLTQQKSKKIHLISMLKAKLQELEQFELYNKIKMLLETVAITVNENLNQRFNGVVLVNNGFSSEVPQNNVNPMPDVKPVKEEDPKKKNMSILLKQFKLNKTNSLLFTKNYRELMQNLPNMEASQLFKQFIEEQNEGESGVTWSYTQYLDFLLLKQDFCGLDLYFTKKAFLKICTPTSKMLCSCKYPLPNVTTSCKKYYKIGCFLLENEANFASLLNSVPYLFKYHLEKMTSLDGNLELILQFGDLDIIKKFVLNYDTCDDMVRLFIKLKSGVCLNCDKNILKKDILVTWKSIALLLIEVMTPIKALQLLQRYDKFIELEELGADFFQTVIFTSTIENSDFIQRGEATRLCQILNQSKDFELLVESFLDKKYLDPPAAESPHEKTSQNGCFFCKLPLDNPILKETKVLTCGHAYHNICCSQIRNVCVMCYVPS